MIRTALIASLVAFVFAVLAPVASAADEVKPPRQTEQAAPTCRTTESPVVDPKAPRLSKAELEALKKLPLCSAEEPQEACPPYDKLLAAAETASRLTRSGSAFWPDWLMEFHRPDCGLDLLGDGREHGNSGGGIGRLGP